ncbi:hypothetical protein [Sphingobacterium corticibacter]|uniref:DUF479 domain-containing protein n=1 Tax=Sphingobacterium corticibacter TaxID=2171749 RepID=A0A2T8HHK6_9SPHI|nr:hypothetical protein [Sphingobacterium corticibacter]PVH24890.1 hypothetical protein DC487_12300 [Sphingobacterium corticibacter]
MNFLSHFYFERYASESARVVGCLLPDLLKNADKDYVFHPNRFEEQLFAHPQLTEIYQGWYRHVDVDKVFHSSTFFLEHNHQLRKKLDPILSHLPIRASFMGHISLELLLDHLLIEHQMVNVNRLYEHLAHVNRPILKRFLEIIGLADTSKFFHFYDQFLEWKYIREYADLRSLPVPLFNISKRVWSFQETEADRHALGNALEEYAADSLNDFREIFRFVNDKLTVV